MVKWNIRNTSVLIYIANVIFTSNKIYNYDPICIIGKRLKSQNDNKSYYAKDHSSASGKLFPDLSLFVSITHGYYHNYGRGYLWFVDCI